MNLPPPLVPCMVPPSEEGGLCLQKKRGGEGRRGELFGAVLPFPLPTLPFPHETRFNANKLAWLRAAQDAAESRAKRSPSRSPDSERNFP